MSAPTLVVIDVQRAFDDPAWGARNNPQAEANVVRLLTAWRATGAPLVHVRHRSADPAGRFAGVGFEPKPGAEERPGERVVEKTVNSSFIGTDLQAMLRTDGGPVVLVGLTTDHCVSTTARMGGNDGFAVTVVEDATATFARTGPDGRSWTAQQMHDSALASLHDEFATVRRTTDVLAEL